MKKIISLLLIVITLCAFAACGKNETQTTTVYKTYQKINYNDFNTFMTNKGYSVMENTDNSAIPFERSFGVNIDDKLSILYYDLDYPERARDLLKTMMQISEVYSCEFSTTVKQENNGFHYLKDEYVSNYFSYVDDTFIHAIVLGESEEEFRKYNNILVDIITTLDYPISELPNF